MAIIPRIVNAWNAFVNNRENEPSSYSRDLGPSQVFRSGLPRFRFNSERSIISSIYTRISIDVAGVNFKHTKLDDKNRYMEDVDSNLNKCLIWESNIDQGPRAFRQDIATTLFDKGVAVIVPVDTTQDPDKYTHFDINTLRVGEVVDWYPRNVRVSLYNDRSGEREEITLEKRSVAIVVNPLYSVMNEQNSTLQRLIRKLSLLDSVDEASSSGKLDLIIQLPYVVKSEARRQQADQRRKDIEFQLKGSQYGIAYTDGTEKITQLNRPAENNLSAQIEFLFNKLYSELGITPQVMDGTADEAAMINYFNRTVEPILDAITQGMQRAFLRDGYETKERIQYFRDPFKLVPLSQVAEIADKFARNEILSSNEIRQYIGVAPSSEPGADKLQNSNMPANKRGPTPSAESVVE